jgi:hypothetical protein
VIATSFSSRFGIDKPLGDDSRALIVSVVASNVVISGPRNPFDFASWFRWLTTPQA